MGRSTVILLMLLASLVGVYQFYLKDKPVNVSNSSISEPSTEPSFKIFDLKSEDISKIVWQFGDSQYGELTQTEPRKWKFVKPNTVVVDDSKVQSYVDSILEISGNSKINLSDTFKLSDVGLEVVKNYISIEKKDGGGEILRFGDSVLSGSSIYVFKEGSTFASTAYSYSVDNLKKKPTDLELLPSPSPSAS